MSAFSFIAPLVMSQIIQCLGIYKTFDDLNHCLHKVAFTIVSIINHFKEYYENEYKC